MSDDDHNIARYFMLGTPNGTEHHVQCTCGEKFSDLTERAVMRKHFQHGILRLRQGSVPE